MERKDYKKFMSLHEFTLRFNHNNGGNNFNAAQLCHLDNTVINDLLKEGYKPSDIMKHVTKMFKGGKKRYNILKKFIEDFDKKQNGKNNI